MSVATVPLMGAFPHEESQNKIYVSSAQMRLQLHQNRSHRKKFTTEDYEWHTYVLTPPSTPTHSMPLSVEKENSLQQHQKLAQPLNKKTDDLKSNLDKFMLCERYHSEYQQQMQKQQQPQQQGKQEKSHPKIQQEKSKSQSNEKEKQKKGSRFFFH